MKKLLVTWFASFLVMFSLAGIFNTILIRDFVAANVHPEFVRNPPNMLLVAAGYLLLALLMAYLYPRFIKEGESQVISGLRFGVMTGVFWMWPYSLILHGAYQFPMAALFIDAGWALFEQGLGGLVVGYIYAKLGVRS